MNAQSLTADRASLSNYVGRHIVLVSLFLAAAALAAHYSGLDERLQEAFYDPVAATFPWRHSSSLELVGHQLLKLVPIAAFLLVLLAAAFAGSIAALRPWRSVLWCLAIALCLGPAVVTQLKYVTAPPCPWDLRQYGGTAEAAASWFAASRTDAGRCLPSGHASAGFSLLALYFAGWAIGRPRWRWGGLAVGVFAGALFGAIRMLQGAHFLSHVLWSAVVCWLVASLIFLPLIFDRLSFGWSSRSLTFKTGKETLDGYD